MTATEYVVLVDAFDQEIGLAEKMAAHRSGLLHRAFSVFLFSRANPRELLLQQRALHKYHTPGLWTNTCCSHPRQGESVILAATRRLEEELGIQASLEDVGRFQYRAELGNDMVEHELDHVLVGWVEKTVVVRANPEEVANTRWVAIDALRRELAEHPEQFTPWFAEALDKAT